VLLCAEGKPAVRGQAQYAHGVRNLADAQPRQQPDPTAATKRSSGADAAAAPGPIAQATCLRGTAEQELSRAWPHGPAKHTSG
jgi:hypothetical protein